MNRTIFWRLMWKEYRTQRAFWICILLLALVLMGVAWFSVLDHEARDRWQFDIALLLPALFAVGCGGMLFAAEHEGGTYEFQRSLPLRSRQLLLVKIVFAFGSTVVMYAITWCAAVALTRMSRGLVPNGLFAWAMLGKLPVPGGHYAPGAVSVFFALELFLWSTLFSLLFRRPLVAAIVGVAAAVASVEVIAWFYPSPYAWERFAAALPSRAAVAAILATVDLLLAFRWLGEQHNVLPIRRFWRRSPVERTNRLCESSGPQVVSRLIWENWRQSRGLLLALGALFVPLVITLLRYWQRIDFMREVKEDSIPQTDFLLSTVLLLAAFPMIGAVTFLCDQHRHSYRFLADRGVRAGQVWLSRQISAWIAGALFTIVASAITVAFVMWLWGDPLSQNVVPLNSLVTYLILSVGTIAMLGLAAGQFCSMLFRNGFLAAFFSLLLTCVLTLWYGLMLLWRINWFWSVLPIALALLLASRLRAPYWLVERKGLRTWLPVGVTLLVPGAVLFTAVPLYRAYQIPIVDPGFSPEEYDHPITAAEQDVNDIYEKAWGQRVEAYSKEDKDSDVETTPTTKPRPLSRGETAWVDANPKAIATALEASRKQSDFYFPWSATNLGPWGQVKTLAHLVILGAVRVEEQGNLDAAMARYLAAIRISKQLRHCSLGERWRSSHADELEQSVYERVPYWAARPKQTPERILGAARAIEELTSHLPPDIDAVKREYLRLHHGILGGYAGIVEASRGSSENWVPAFPLTSVWVQLPWERARALRLLNVLTRRQLDWLAALEAATEGGKAILQPPYENYPEPELPFALHDGIHLPPLEGPVAYDQYHRIHCYTAMVALRRGVQLSLLLQAWKLRHGELPKSLDELIGPDMDRIPIDPFTGTPFRFVREGVAIPFRSYDYFLQFHYLGIGARVPFVWSAGPRVGFKGLGERQKEPAYFDYWIVDDLWSKHPHSHSPQSEFEVWEAGWPIPVP